MQTYLSPRAHRIVTRTEVNTLSSLDGVTIGLFHNSKPNAAMALDIIAAELQKRYRIAGVVRDSKPLPSSPAEAEAIASMAEACGAVIYATAD